jgi:hypothetical protein
MMDIYTYQVPTIDRYLVYTYLITTKCVTYLVTYIVTTYILYLLRYDKYPFTWVIH